MLVVASFVLLLPLRLESPAVVNLLSLALLAVGPIAVLFHSPYHFSGAQLRILVPLSLLVLSAIVAMGAATNPVIHARFVAIAMLLFVGAAVGMIVLTAIPWRLFWLVTAVASGVGYLSLIHIALKLPFGDEFLSPRALGPIQFGLPRRTRLGSLFQRVSARISST